MSSKVNTEISKEDLTVWAGSLASLEAVMEASLRSKGQVQAKDGEDDEEDDSHLLSVQHGIAIITVHGSLTSTDAWYNRYFGITSYNDIRNAIIEALEDEEVDKILLDVDSPGGDAKGVNDLAEFIKYADNLKPVHTYVSGTAFSAAYWIAAATRSISGPKMSEAGSIGVIAVLMEYTKMLKDDGIGVRVFRGGKYKALGNPYEELSAKAVEIIQERIDTMEGFFLDAVSEYRGIARSKVKSTVGEGLTFFAAEAVKNGLMDEIISFDELFGRLVKTSNSNSASNGKKVLTEDIDMAKKILTEAAVAAIAAGASEAEVEHLMEDASEVVAETEETEVDASETVSEEAETEEHTDIEASASEDDDPVAEPANDTSLVSYLKGEVARLSEENAKLVSLSGKAKSALASESALKCIVNEAIARMSVPLGITHMNLSSMESSVLIEQYENVKTQFASKFKVSGMAAVKDEDESASVDDDLSPVEEARLRANKL